MEAHMYEREKLYREIWCEPLVKVAKRYNVSDVALRKTCKKLNIPMPTRGYWAKVYSGELISIPPLPELKGNYKIDVKNSSERPVNRASNSKITNRLKHLPIEQRESIISFCSSIVVPDELVKPHSLIKDTIHYFKSKKDNTKPPISRVFYVKATDEQIERVYRILDTLFKAFECLGYNITLSTPKSQFYRNYEPSVWDNVINIQLDKDSLQIAIRELQQRVSHIPTETEILESKKYSFTRVPEYDIVYNGRLNFEIDDYNAKQRNWRDGVKRRLEDQIEDIILTIMEAINDKKIRREQGEAEVIRKKEEERKRAIMHEKRETERAKVNQLVSNANDYCQAMKVYEYIATLERNLLNIEDKTSIEQMKGYISWAKLKADWINPLVRREDEILGGKYTDIITNSNNKDNKS